LQRLAPAPRDAEGALFAPTPEPEAGAEPISGVVPAFGVAPGVLLPVVLSAEPLLAPALEFEVPSALALPDAALEV